MQVSNSDHKHLLFFFFVVVVVVFESKELSQYKGDLIKHTNKQTQMVTNNRIGKKRKNR